MEIRVSNQVGLIVGCLMVFKLYVTLLNLHTMATKLTYSIHDC